MKGCARAYDSCSHNNDSHGSAILKAEDRIQKTEFRTPNPTPETANVEPKTRDRPPGKRLRNRLSDKDLGLRPGSGWEDRGRDKGKLCPSLRTEQAVFLHSALQLVVTFKKIDKPRRELVLRSTSPTCGSRHLASVDDHFLVRAPSSCFAF